MFDWNLEVVDKSKGTVQFKEDLTIEDSEEMDLLDIWKQLKMMVQVLEVQLLD